MNCKYPKRYLNRLLFSVRPITQVLSMIVVSAIPSLANAQVSGDEPQSQRESDSLQILNLFQATNQLSAIDMEKALDAAVRALQLSEKTAIQPFIQTSLLKIGGIFFYSGMYDEAVRYYSKYLDRAIESGNISQQLMIRTNIQAVKLTSNDEYDPVLETEMEVLLNEFRARYQDTGDKSIIRSTIPTCLNNLSLLIQEKENGDLETAERYIQEALDISETYNLTENDKLRFKTTYASLLMKMDRLEDAHNLLSTIVNESSEKGLTQFEGLAYHSIGDIYQEMGNVSSAIEAYQKALDIIDGSNFSLIKKSAEQIAALYESVGKDSEAFQYLRISQQAEDSIRNQAAMREIAQIELKQALSQLETELTEKSNLNITRLLALSGILLFISLIGISLLLVNRRKNRNEKLERMKAQLEAEQLILEKELLVARLNEKDKQLTSELVYKISRGNMIDSAVAKLIELNRSSRSRIKIIDDVVSELRKSRNEDIWNEFDATFQETHQDFYIALNEACPSLTLNERRLAAMLKLNMNSREISIMTGQSQRAIELARIRLRKKLGLTNTPVKLIEFLTSLTSS
ncbi:MAG: tetratricopeptide repeat protein [Saprospiraceae bacterium]